jgi:transcriptional regulator with XRE-family HTH domain
MSIGEIIQQYCRERGITQKQFARASKVSSGYISMLVNEKNPKSGRPIVPTIDTFDNIASAMCISTEELFAMMNGRQRRFETKSSMSIKERLNAIAEALETASKQARLLAEEVDRGCTVTSASIGKAIRDNQRI